MRPQRSRHEPGSERSFYERLATSEHHSLDRIDLLNLIKGGEDSYIELKVRLTNNEKIAAEIVALANTGGGAIIFGVNDNRRVEGLDDVEQVEEDLREICRTQMTPPLHPYIDKVAFDNGRRIVVLEIEDRRAPHFVGEHRYYLREGSSIREARGDEVARLYARLKPTGYESVPLYGANINDIDESFIWSYLRALQGELFNSKGFPTNTVLKDLQLGIEFADTIAPNVGGLLLFGYRESLEKKFNRSRIQASRISGDSASDPVVEKTEFSGNLATLFEQAFSFISRYVDVWDSATPKVPRNRNADPVLARANYNRAVLAEALTNALVHRDYCVREQATRVLIYDTRLEIINSCNSAVLPRKGTEVYGLVSAPHPRLKAIFKSPAYGLKTVEGGIPLLRRAAFRYAQKEPKITILPEEFKVEIFAG